jgi:hypothetical protein
MVPENDPCKRSPLESLASHCLASDDHVIYIRVSYGWGGLVDHLNQFDGPWRHAVRIDIKSTGIDLTDCDGRVRNYNWAHFGIMPKRN